MEKPINLSVDYDPEVGPLGYVRYRELAEGARVAESVRISEDVVIDMDDSGLVLGIKLLGLEDEALAVAEFFATQNGLEFPALLSRSQQLATA